MGPRPIVDRCIPPFLDSGKRDTATLLVMHRLVPPSCCSHYHFQLIIESHYLFDMCILLSIMDIHLYFVNGSIVYDPHIMSITGKWCDTLTLFYCVLVTYLNITYYLIGVFNYIRYHSL